MTSIKVRWTQSWKQLWQQTLLQFSRVTSEEFKILTSTDKRCANS